ncbi:hypothetical protein PINS_up023634 [Pythium insidiosum]|nr:hypothetical protein PINS_up023634 [Pythium insidiosum]
MVRSAQRLLTPDAAPTAAEALRAAEPSSERLVSLRDYMDSFPLVPLSVIPRLSLADLLECERGLCSLRSTLAPQSNPDDAQLDKYVSRQLSVVQRHMEPARARERVLRLLQGVEEPEMTPLPAREPAIKPLPVFLQASPAPSSSQPLNKTTAMAKSTSALAAQRSSASLLPLPAKRDQLTRAKALIQANALTTKTTAFVITCTESSLNARRRKRSQKTQKKTEEALAAERARALEREREKRRQAAYQRLVARQELQARKKQEAEARKQQAHEQHRRSDGEVAPSFPPTEATTMMAMTTTAASDDNSSSDESEVSNCSEGDAADEQAILTMAVVTTDSNEAEEKEEEEEIGQSSSEEEEEEEEERDDAAGHELYRDATAAESATMSNQELHDNEPQREVPPVTEAPVKEKEDEGHGEEQCADVLSTADENDCVSPAKEDVNDTRSLFWMWRRRSNVPTSLRRFSDSWPNARNGRWKTSVRLNVIVLRVRQSHPSMMLPWLRQGKIKT